MSRGQKKRNARERVIARLAEEVRLEVQRRLPPNSTFEQRNDMSAQVMQEVLFKQSDDDLRAMVAKEEEETVEDDEGPYRRMKQASSATYVGRWGVHFIEEPLYRKVGVHNGPTVKPIELRAGIIEHMTPDMARVVGELSACESSRQIVRTLRATGLHTPSRAFLARRVSKMSEEIEEAVSQLEEAARAAETIPADVASVSCGMDRMSARMSEPASAETIASRVQRTEPYERAVPPPKEFHYRKAWVGSMSLYDATGKELRTLRYGTDASADHDALAERVASDVLAIVRAHPNVKLHCVQDAAPELRALPEALSRTLPAGTTVVQLVDLEHLMGYLKAVVAAVEPEGDPHDWAGWYRSELLLHDDAIDRIWSKLRRLACSLPGRRTTARKAVAEALSYIRHRKPRMRYATHHGANLPIGSGATESTCWQMQERVKRAGQSWESRGLRGVMGVRGLVLSDRWVTSWPAYAANHRRELRGAA